ncbi:hypothetical protein HORIV_03060 [Vreelandella olivaria]|uniref:Beta-lactamase-related domain-containing protein n=1 Tax=Vreelandella olivaria TaxID=390919 RepID=A0ABN5WS40_9GAMM|nr:hypothetical protein HORIV_03060 [Halomonas olivaria]
MGYLTAQRLGQPFEMLMEEALFAPLGLEHSYYQVPESQQDHYAYGYSKRISPYGSTQACWMLKLTV